MTATTPEVGTVNLLDKLTEGRKLPRGCDSWAIKSVRPDGATSHGFVWPLTKKTVTAAGPLLDHKSACPKEPGDGLCLATSWRGMASGGIPAITLLLVAFSSANVRGTDEAEGKLRVSACVVVEVVDGARLLREQGSGADLTGANLNGANLNGANLNGADLTGANLTGADLSGADLTGAYLTRANLTRANLSWANLTGANLYGANLYGANLYGANLNGANLNGANLTGANLTGADLSWADLSGADLTGANLTRADLSGANLSWADLSGANLYGANLYGARVYSTTSLPAGFDAVAAGCVIVK